MVDLSGKVALVTGAARGQGRSHCVHLARAGADIIALDICKPIASVAYPPSTESDLADTVSQIEALDRRVISGVVDIRDAAGLATAVSEAVAQLGRLDIVSVNAGICPPGAMLWEVPPEQFQEVIDINLVGSFNTARAVVPHLIESGPGSVIVFTSSAVGLKAIPNCSDYVASKFGVVGIMRSLAIELGPHGVRSNAVCPTTVDTDMVLNDAMYKLFRPDLDEPTQEDAIEAFSAYNLLGVPWVHASDVSNALLWLVSPEARYVTGIALPVDAGTTTS